MQESVKELDLELKQWRHDANQADQQRATDQSQLKGQLISALTSLELLDEKVLCDF